jgi:hypothetical protein
MDQMKILVACEESQAVAMAFNRFTRHIAFSCDLLPGRIDEAFHLKGDVRQYLNDYWDMIIAFPPCTDLAASGSKHFHAKRKAGKQRDAVNFFMLFANHPCPKKAIENPVGIIPSVWRSADQIIQPWQFGHRETKATCLWLEGLPKLKPTDIVGPPPPSKLMTLQDKQQWNRVHRMPKSKDRSLLRSETYSGIAMAMALQWGGDV